MALLDHEWVLSTNLGVTMDAILNAVERAFAKSKDIEMGLNPMLIDEVR